MFSPSIGQFGDVFETLFRYGSGSALKETATGAVFGKPMRGLRAGLGGLGKMAPFIALDFAYSSAIARRGHFASGLGATIGGTSGSLVGSAVGGLIAGLPGAFIGSLIGDPVMRGPAARLVQNFAEFGRNQRRLNFGSYEDSQPAFTMRQVAAREISQSLLNARQYLGKEALLLHN
jgi:hypothetical protein